MPLETQKNVDVTSKSPEADRTRTSRPATENSLADAVVVPDDAKNAPSINEVSTDSNDEMTRLADQFIATPTDTTKKHLKGIALKAYGSQTRPRNEDKLVLEFLPMVHKITQQVVSYLHPPLSREDLVSAGTIGLVKAARDFNPTKDAVFKTYAYIRIRGAVIDELRSWSFTPASLKKQFDKAQQILRDTTEKTGHMPSDEYIA
ncbi:MAG: sigma-70 family RNA polymerase sigma factor, partial [Planctomycetes bacterium]|nr:sigma-70 family RNA polymerase sigma factor [Planctomycetota bacterium]